MKLSWKLLGSVVPVAGAFLLFRWGDPGTAIFVLVLNLIAWIRWSS